MMSLLLDEASSTVFWKALWEHIASPSNGIHQLWFFHLNKCRIIIYFVLFFILTWYSFQCKWLDGDCWARPPTRPAGLAAYIWSQSLVVIKHMGVQPSAMPSCTEASLYMTHSVFRNLLISWMSPIWKIQHRKQVNKDVCFFHIIIILEIKLLNIWSIYSH